MLHNLMEKQPNVRWAQVDKCIVKGPNKTSTSAVIFQHAENSACLRGSFLDAAVRLDDPCLKNLAHHGEHNHDAPHAVEFGLRVRGFRVRAFLWWFLFWGRVNPSSHLQGACDLLHNLRLSEIEICSTLPSANFKTLTGLV